MSFLYPGGVNTSPRTRIALAIAAICLLGAVSAAAQTGSWDPDTYLDLVRRGEEAYDEALATPAGQPERRRELLFESARIKQTALSLLRTALITDTVTEFREEAVADYFNLNQNLVVILVQLDQCAAAELLLYEAANAPGLAEQAVEIDLESLQVRVDDCNERVGSTAGGWDVSSYRDLEREGRLAFEDAEAMPESDEAGRSAFLYQSMRATEAAATLLHNGLVEGRAQAFLDTPEADYLDLTEQSVEVFLALGLCEAAESRLLVARETPQFLPGDADGVLGPLGRRVDACVPARAAAQEPEPPRVTPTPAPIVTTDGLTPLQTAGWALVAAGTAAAVSFFIVDLSLADEVDELDTQRAACESGTCDIGRTRQLADTIDGGRTAEWILLGSAVALVGTGVALVLSGGDDGGGGDRAAFAPILGPDAWGASYSLDF